jgi:DNA-binding transcriptional LysR family regulator
MAQLRQFLERGDRWAIVPVSVAKGLASECRIRQLNVDVPLPHREISCVVSSHRPVPALDSFLDCLRQVLATYPEIKILL